MGARKFGSHAVHTDRTRITSRGYDNAAVMDILLHVGKYPQDNSPQTCDRLYMAGIAEAARGDSEEQDKFFRMVLQRDPSYLPELRGFTHRGRIADDDPIQAVKGSFKSAHRAHDWDESISRFKRMQRDEFPRSSPQSNGAGYGNTAPTYRNGHR